MFRPRDTLTRERKPLTGLWRFRLDGAGEGRAARWFAGPLPDAREMAVPASFNDVAVDQATHDFFGDIWYQTTVRVPRGWDGRRVVLYFESATHRATVWVGDREVVSHEGGYLPFEADVTEHVRAGDEVRITAVINNSLSFQTIPPGIVEDAPSGKHLRYWFDFFNYAGIHRPVWLYCTDRAHLTDLTVVTGLDGTTGTVEYQVEAEGAEGSETRVVLRDAEGSEVARGTGASGTLTVPDVHKWAPGDGYLYDLEVQLVDGDTVVDDYLQPVGVRTVAVDGTRFLINGEPFHFTGFGMHEDLAVIGRGHNDAFMLRNFELLKWVGCQLVPDLALPLRRGGDGVRRPAGHRGHRRDARGGAEHRAGHRRLRRQDLHHLLPGDGQRRDPQGARAGDPGAGGPGQEPSQRGAVVDRQ
jgi:beta-glucuronidase